MNRCDVEIGDYFLLPENLDILPYENKFKVIFTDSLLNHVTFQVSFANTYVSDAIMYKYNVHTQGDTVKYCYSSQRKTFNLRNDSLGISFSNTVYASPYYSDPESGFIADLMDVYYSDLHDNLLTAYGVFSKMLNQRTFPYAFGENEKHTEISFHGKTFVNVEKSNSFEPKILVYYNFTEGIVAFTDKTEKLWRFESF